jgi:hypothetical protein
MLSEKTKRSVDKYKIECSATKYRLDIDQVNLFKAKISPSTDIWGNLCASCNGNGQFHLEKLVDRLEVPLEVTISNVLQIGSVPDVTCYVLRRAAMPTYDESGQFIRNDSYCDGRFRRKLHNRMAQHVVSLEPRWEPGPVVPDGATFLPPPSYVHESDGGDENSPESSDDNMDDVEAEVDGSFPYNSINDIVPAPSNDDGESEDETQFVVWPQGDWEKDSACDGSWDRCESDSDGSFFEINDANDTDCNKNVL